MVGKCMNKTKSNKKKSCRQVITSQSENWTRHATPALFGPVSRCVRLFREQREQTPPSSVWADLGRFPTTCGGRKSKQSAMDLSRGKITFCVYRGISEKGAENQALAAGHLK